jgi:hypothetical protein
MPKILARIWFVRLMNRIPAVPIKSTAGAESEGFLNADRDRAPIASRHETLRSRCGDRLANGPPCSVVSSGVRQGVSIFLSPILLSSKPTCLSFRRDTTRCQPGYCKDQRFWDLGPIASKLPIDLLSLSSNGPVITSRDLLDPLIRNTAPYTIDPFAFNKSLYIGKYVTCVEGR